MSKIINLDNLATYSVKNDYENNRIISQYFHYPKSEIDVQIPQKIVDKIIRVAAKITERFGSDAFYTLTGIMKKIYSTKDETKTVFTWFVGFGESGVNDNEGLSNGTIEKFRETYRQVWKLKYSRNGEDELWGFTRMSTSCYESTFDDDLYIEEVE